MLTTSSVSSTSSCAAPSASHRASAQGWLASSASADTSRPWPSVLERRVAEAQVSLITLSVVRDTSRMRAQAVEERLTAAGARNLGRELHCAPTRRIEEAFGKLQHFEAAAPDGGGATHGFRRWLIVVT